MTRDSRLCLLALAAMAGCTATPPLHLRRIPAAAGDLEAIVATPATTTSTTQNVAEAKPKRRRGYLTIGGGYTGQFLDSTTAGSNVTSSTDQTTLQGNIGLGFFPAKWLDLGIVNDAFFTETKVRTLNGSSTVNSSSSKSVSNNLGLFGNFVLAPQADTSLYIGPNVGIYTADIGGVDSTEASYGFQVGIRTWLSRSTALKFEWRNVWSQQDADDSFPAVENDLYRTSLLIGFDLSF